MLKNIFNKVWLVISTCFNHLFIMFEHLFNMFAPSFNVFQAFCDDPPSFPGPPGHLLGQCLGVRERQDPGSATQWAQSPSAMMAREYAWDCVLKHV